MPTSTTNVMVTTDHAIPVEPLGGTATVKVNSGDTVYYNDNPTVDATHNIASITSGNSATVSAPAWVKSAGTSSVTITGADAASVVSGAADKVLVFSQSGSLAVATGALRARLPFAATITSAAATVNTAPTGASVIIDVKKNGTTIFTTQANRPTIAISANTSADKVPDVTAVAAGDYITVDVAQIGSTAPGQDLVVSVWYS